MSDFKVQTGRFGIPNDAEYKQNITCQNCNMQLSLLIKKGVPMKKVLRQKPICPTCGCNVAINQEN